MANEDHVSPLAYETEQTRRDVRGRIPDGYLGHRAAISAGDDDDDDRMHPGVYMAVWMVVFVTLVVGLSWFVISWVNRVTK